MRSGMDAIDERIMLLLQKKARTTIKDIAAQVYLSSPAVTARIERLEKKNIIKGYHAQFDMQELGYRIKAFVSLKVEPIQKREFYEYIATVPNVMECNCVTGEYAMLMEVLFTDNMELDEFIGKLQRFGETRTQIVFSTAVEHRDPPVPSMESAWA